MPIVKRDTFGPHGANVPSDSRGNVRYNARMVGRAVRYGLKNGREAMLQRYVTRLSPKSLAVASAELSKRQFGQLVFKEFEKRSY